MAGVAALALGTTARPQPAAACDACSTEDGHGQICPDGCSVGTCGTPPPPCHCYFDTDSYCADAATDLVCLNYQTVCHNRAGQELGCVDRPEQCCGDKLCGGPYYCAHEETDLCCWGDEIACFTPGLGWGCMTATTCPCAVLCGGACCATDQVCKKGTCGKCKAKETACGTDCCSADQRCEDGKCSRACPKGQDPCAGGCCDKGQACRGGVCVKKRRK